MSLDEAPASAIASQPAVSAERVSSVARAARVDAWQTIKKSFAFALAADDYQTAWLDRLSKLAK